MKVKVKKRNDPNAQLQKCTFFDSCFGACDWCKTHDYSEACVPMLQQRTQTQKMSIHALQSVLDEVRNEVENAEAKRGSGCVPVVHGYWISLTDCANAGVYCSVCQKKVWKEDYAWCNRKNKLRSNYCPNCGATMDGGIDNE